MKITVYPEPLTFDCNAALKIVEQIKNKPNSVLGLPTGGTPVGMYRELVRMFKNNTVNFSMVTTFNLDEYIGIPRCHPCSYHSFMEENLFQHININRENIYIPNGEARSTDQECIDYEAKIRKAGGIDLQVLGIGSNGHIGFNEPGTPFESITHVTDLTSNTIEANSRFFDSPDQVPRQAITAGIKTIMQAKSILLLAKGKSKAEVMKKALYGPVTTDVPASVLQLHPDLHVILDEEAAFYLIKK